MNPKKPDLALDPLQVEAQRRLQISTEKQLTDIIGLRSCGIFPKDKEPSVATLRNWTKLRRIPHHRVGHFIYYDVAEVANHIRTRLKVPARG